MHLTAKAENREPPSIPDVIVLTRRLQIGLGIFFGALAFFCAAGLMLVLILPFFDRSNIPRGNDVLLFFLVCGFLLCCGTYLTKICIRFLKGRDEERGSASPRVLRLASYAFLLPVLVIIFEGDYGYDFVSKIFVSLIYLGVFSYLRRLASQRAEQMHNQSSDPTRSSVTPPAGQEPRPR